MGITYADLRLANQSRLDLEEIDASALVDTGALHLCIPEHVAMQLQLEPARSKTNRNTLERLRCWDGKNRKAL